MGAVLEGKISPPWPVGVKQINHLMGEWVRENFGENQAILGGKDNKIARIECFQ